MRLALIVGLLALAATPAIGLDNGAVTERAVAECKRIYREDATPSHKHPCPCPDDTMANGAACGGRSAYLKPGGARPVCSTKDMTPDIIAAVNRGDAGVVLAERSPVRMVRQEWRSSIIFEND